MEYFIICVGVARSYPLVFLWAPGNVYIITCSDYFTKWPEAAGIPDKSAKSVANFLFKLITRHGSPAIVQSDQGREFINQV